jgi:hypothetical protein
MPLGLFELLAAQLLAMTLQNTAKDTALRKFFAENTRVVVGC